jgi:hypothetical protein
MDMDQLQLRAGSPGNAHRQRQGTFPEGRSIQRYQQRTEHGFDPFFSRLWAKGSKRCAAIGSVWCLVFGV